MSKGETPLQYGELFDSISVCLSKGLGAPVGSLLLGSRSYIQEARRIRKVLGGGMRQAGYLAAAGKYALEHHIDRLKIDHLHAKKIGDALAKKTFIGKMYPIETNILIFEVKESFTAASFTEYLHQLDILCIPISSNYVRMVTHLDVSAEMVAQLIKIIEQM